MATKRPTTFSMRMPEDLNEKINAYAAQHSCTKAEAMSHFARAGIELEENGPAPSAATNDVAASATQETLAKIDERLEALQRLPTIEPDEPMAIVPVDIRDKIQAYSTEHECSEQDALTYYARLGIQLSGDTRAATNADMAELRTRLDALAQDSQHKSEQLAQMAEVLASIREYTKPDELELEGEVEDDAEDVEDEPELSEEERQRIADEHTRQIVSDVMGEYVAMQRTEPATSPMAQWVPVLIAVIVSLIIGLVVVVTVR